MPSGGKKWIACDLCTPHSIQCHVDLSERHSSWSHNAISDGHKGGGSEHRENDGGVIAIGLWK